MTKKAKIASLTSGTILAVWAIFTLASATGGEKKMASLDPITENPAIVARTASGMRQEKPAIVRGTGQYLVVWNEQEADDYYSDVIRAARLSADRQSLDPQGFVIARRHGYIAPPRIAFDGNNYLVAWYEEPGGGYISDPGEIRAARVTQAGRVLDPDGFSATTSATKKGFGNIIFTGGVFMIVWTEDQHSVKVARIYPDGRAPDPQGITVREYPKDHRFVSQYLSHLQLVAVEDCILVIWCWLGIDGNKNEQRKILARRLNTDGKSPDDQEFLLTADEPDLWYQKALSDGKRVLVWWSKRSNWQDTHGTFITAEGKVSNPGGTPIGQGLQGLQILRNGSDFYLFWSVIEYQPKQKTWTGDVEPSYIEVPQAKEFHGYRGARLSFDRPITPLDGVLLEKNPYPFDPTYTSWEYDGKGSFLFAFTGSTAQLPPPGGILVASFKLSEAL